MAQRGDLINQMRALLKSPDAPKTQAAAEARTLLAAYDAHLNQIKVGTQDGFVGQSQSSINQEWKDSLYTTVAAHPEVTNIVTGLFLSLPQASTTPTTTSDNAPGVFSTKTWNPAP